MLREIFVRFFDTIGNKSLQMSDRIRMKIVTPSDTGSKDDSLFLEPSQKHDTLREFAKTYKLQIFVETGTYYGDTVDALKNIFKTCYSIEIGKKLADNARVRFSNNPNIHIFQGDSSKVLPRLLREINEPCLFWLDGHYSGGDTAGCGTTVPILQEIEAILNHRDDHVILIDDARCFVGGKSDYPTISYLSHVILKKQPQFTVEVRDDIIRAYKK